MESHVRESHTPTRKSDFSPGPRISERIPLLLSSRDQMEAVVGKGPVDAVPLVNQRLGGVEQGSTDAECGVVAYLGCARLGKCFLCRVDKCLRFPTDDSACGVEYFDLYLMHVQNAEIFRKFRACRAYETAFDLKCEGKVRHVGLSFHGRAEVLDEILTLYPEIEAVQIQFNYVDYDDPAMQSRRCYEVCRKHGKPIIVMEPVKGGTLVNLPGEAKADLEDLHGGSAASYAIRYAAGFEGIRMVLSGMSDLAQLEDNLSYMKDFQPLNATERAAVTGAFSGRIAKNPLWAFAAVPAAFATGRGAFFLAVVALQNLTAQKPAMIAAQLRTGLAGVAIQMVLVPLLVLGIAKLTDWERGND